jgi:hypothetical protein
MQLHEKNVMHRSCDCGIELACNATAEGQQKSSMPRFPKYKEHLLLRVTKADPGSDLCGFETAAGLCLLKKAIEIHSRPQTTSKRKNGYVIRSLCVRRFKTLNLPWAELTYAIVVHKVAKTT